MRIGEVGTTAPGAVVIALLSVVSSHMLALQVEEGSSGAHAEPPGAVFSDQGGLTEDESGARPTDRFEFRMYVPADGPSQAGAQAAEPISACQSPNAFEGNILPDSEGFGVFSDAPIDSATFVGNTFPGNGLGETGRSDTKDIDWRSYTGFGPGGPCDPVFKGDPNLKDQETGGPAPSRRTCRLALSGQRALTDRGSSLRTGL
jgi:hypothetical protein